MNKQDQLRTGIRVKHLQSKKYTQSQHSDIDSLNKYLDQLDFSTSKLQNQHVSSKKRIGQFKAQSFNTLTSNMKPIPIKMDEPLKTVQNKPSLNGSGRQFGVPISKPFKEEGNLNKVGQPVNQIQQMQPINQLILQSANKQQAQSQAANNQHMYQSPKFGLNSKGSIENAQVVNWQNGSSQMPTLQRQSNQVQSRHMPQQPAQQHFQTQQPQQVQQMVAQQVKQVQPQQPQQFTQTSQQQQLSQPPQQQQFIQQTQQPQQPQQPQLPPPLPPQQPNLLQKPTLQSTQQTMQSSTRSQDNPMFVSLRDPSIKTDTANNDTQIYKRVQSMQKQIEMLTQMLSEKQKRQQLNDRRIEQIMRLRDIDNERKDSQISKHLNKIDQLLNDVQNKQRTIEKLQYQLLRNKNKSIGQVKQSGYSQQLQIRKHQYEKYRPKPTNEFEVKWSSAKQEEEYLSPLMVNVKKQSRLTIEDSKNFRFQDLRDMSDLQF